MPRMARDVDLDVGIGIDGMYVVEIIKAVQEVGQSFAVLWRDGVLWHVGERGFSDSQAKGLSRLFRLLELSAFGDERDAAVSSNVQKPMVDQGKLLFFRERLVG